MKPIILFAKNAIKPYVREGKISPSDDLISWLKHGFASMWILLLCSSYEKDCLITVLNHMLLICVPEKFDFYVVGARWNNSVHDLVISLRTHPRFKRAFERLSSKWHPEMPLANSVEIVAMATKYAAPGLHTSKIPKLPGANVSSFRYVARIGDCAYQDGPKGSLWTQGPCSKDSTAQKMKEYRKRDGIVVTKNDGDYGEGN